ncbi:hypothetical protein ABIG06_001394 [Bradyrhizobium sp. USDA 326]
MSVAGPAILRCWNIPAREICGANPPLELLLAEAAILNCTAAQWPISLEMILPNSSHFLPLNRIIWSCSIGA